MKRTTWEIAVLVVLLLAGYGFWKWSQGEAQRAIDAQAEQQEEARSQLQTSYENWAESLADSEARAVFKAYAAGIHPALLSDRTEALEQSKQQLLHLEHLVFVHLLQPDGTVIFSSDEKLATSGISAERGHWALALEELDERPGEIEGTLELAAPIRGSGGSGVEAVLWLGYDTRSLRQDTHPALSAL